MTGSGILLLFVISGCVSKQQRETQQAVADYFTADYPAAIKRLETLAQKTDQNFVLNNARLGSAALADYQIDIAEAAFLNAYEVINSVGVNNGGRSIGAVLVDEKIKVWKGEPFERAMVNFYLGVVYYMRQDYGNARAAFENALFKLRDYGEEKDNKDDQYHDVESNFALAYLMLGRTFQRLNRPDLARANFDRAVELRSDLQGLASYSWNESSNLLLIVDFGYGPKKVTGFDGSIVGFGPKPADEGRIPRPRVSIDGKPVDITAVDNPPVDLLALAQDRRWQSIDTIRVVKSAIGTGLMAASVYSASKERYEEAAALFAAGLLLKATSQADIRQWEMLPRTTFILPLRVEPGEHDVTVEFGGPYGMSQSWRKLRVPESGEATYYFRMQRYRSGPYDWPPPGMSGLTVTANE